MDNKISESGDSIKVIVKDQHDVKMYFMMKKDVPVKKLLLDYCRRQGLVFRELNFLLNGSRFQPHLTPNELEMETGDEFEAMSPVLGGAGA